MKRLAGLILGTALVVAAATHTFTGVVTDTMCGANHSMMNVKPDSKCVRECVKTGSKYALLTGGKMYTFSDQSAPAKFAGEKVTVTGALDESAGTIEADKIVAAK